MLHTVSELTVPLLSPQVGGSMILQNTDQLMKLHVVTTRRTLPNDHLKSRVNKI